MGTYKDKETTHRASQPVHIIRDGRDEKEREETSNIQTCKCGVLDRCMDGDDRWTENERAREITTPSVMFLEVQGMCMCCRASCLSAQIC